MRLRRAAIVLMGMAALAPVRAAEAETGPLAVKEGYLVNFVRRWYLPLGGKWTAPPGGDADLQSLPHASLRGVTMNILCVPGGGTGFDLAATMNALRETAKEERGTSVLAESRKHIGWKEAGELLTLREGRGPGTETRLVRTIAFAKGADKYYVRLDTPPAAFEEASRDFDAAVSGLKFEFKMFSAPAE